MVPILVIPAQLKVKLMEMEEAVQPFIRDVQTNNLNLILPS
jgi:hypothetical protein